MSKDEKGIWQRGYDAGSRVGIGEDAPVPNDLTESELVIWWKGFDAAIIDRLS